MHHYYFIILLIIFGSSCKNKTCPDTGYNWQLPASLTPAIDTFKIGDTIHIVSKFPDMVLEKQTGDYLKVENFQFYPTTRLEEISNEEYNIHALEDFEILIDTIYNFEPYNYSVSEAIEIIGQYRYQANEYALEYRLIPLKTGIYLHTLYSFVNALNPEQQVSSSCADRTVSGADVVLNEGADNNIDLLNLSPQEHYNTWILLKPGERFHDKGGYVFHVVE